MRLQPCLYRGSLALLTLSLLGAQVTEAFAVSREADSHSQNPRVRESLNADWRFSHSKTIPDNIVYDLRPGANDTSLVVLKPWILPSGNDYIKNPEDKHKRPSHEPAIDIPFVDAEFDDSDWEPVRLPHDWAIKGPFYTGENPEISGSMGRLPVQGVGWYRRKLRISSSDLEKTVFLEIDGAMAYPMVWLNGHLVGGWPYGYNSFQLDLTRYLEKGENQLAIRVENPSGASSRWYPGAGIYRNVWLTTVNPTHVAHSGTKVTTRDISPKKATVDFQVQVANSLTRSERVEVVSVIFEIGKNGRRGRKIQQFPRHSIRVGADSKAPVSVSTTVRNPKLWGPPPSQSPELYVILTQLYSGRRLLDTYETKFGIRSLDFDPDTGLSVNGIPLRIQGVNQHHDLGALGAAFNKRAAQRQLDTLRDLGVNAIRMAHNPPAPELLEMTDQMGFLVVDEIFDSWVMPKTESDFHLIFPDWREPDLRSFMRRDRNHPSVIVWSYGNENAEQESYDAWTAEIATYLREILVQEDMTRPSTGSMHRSTPTSLYTDVVGIICLNYQGEGTRYGPAYAHLDGNRKPPQYSGFHEAHPDKVIIGSEVAWSLSSRGSFLFPVTNYTSAPVNDTSGGNSTSLEISAYELYSADAGSSPDRVFSTQDEHPFVAGGFVWAGWDYLGEPYPYGEARSAYSGIIDLAGFKKERFFLYQSRWRPDFPMAHILPHWTWPCRVGKVTPVHVFTSGDEAELFLNGVSQGRIKKQPLTYRLKWDHVIYKPGELHVVTYKDGRKWATDTVRTVGKATGLRGTADRNKIESDGEDLSFVSVEVIDAKGRTVPEADSLVRFSVSGPGEIVATDNGFQSDFTPFPSHDRKVFNGLALCIVRAKVGASGRITVKAESEGLNGAEVILETR
ncbi:putative cell-associated beta-galactosidase [Aspergillus affinis]|uniref:putative cell-associated beta-galactosidase n=1 Tax=Aspergillus affinis TaxID=1070780 RepID=UPI0022FE5802|nr:Beta-galactosidase [Aspergillus affinis]KAI9036906.1 Beta-galactosidase [Aspergillus affinis]